MSHNEPLLQRDEKQMNKGFYNSKIEPRYPDNGPYPNKEYPDNSEEDDSQESAHDQNIEPTYLDFRKKECSNQEQCSNLIEPDFCTSSYIQSLETEYKALKNDEIVQKPVSIYLKNCERFGRQNMHHENIEIQKYQFRREDKEFLQAKYTNQKNNITEIDDLTFSKSIKIFTDIIFHEDRQILVVKTWQKILYQNLSADNIKKAKSMNSYVAPKSRQQMMHYEDPDDQVSDNSAILDIPDGFENDRFFFIKTLQLFKDNGQPLSNPILVEQVPGIFEEHKAFEVSITQFEHKIYYFKKVYTQEGSSLVDLGMLSSQKDKLQLYSYNLKTREELPVNRFSIEESKAVNTIFSKQFGEQKEETIFEDEFEFLRNQYIITQEYIKANEYKQLFVIQFIDSIEKPIKILTQTPVMDTFSQSNDANRAVQIVHHIFEQDQKNVIFIVQNMFVVVQVKCDIKDPFNVSSENIKVYERNSLDVFQKIWNTSFLRIQKVQLKAYNQHNHYQEVFDQYFFIDSRNKIQLIYPNYQKKIDRTQKTDMILDQVNVETINYQEVKKINIASQVPSNQNIVQKIEDLKRILNHEQIQQSCQFVFCKDKKNKKQNLYMCSPKSKQICIWWLKQHNCVECKQFENVDNEIMMAQKSQQLLEDQNQNSVMTIMKQVQCTLGRRIIQGNQRYNKGQKNEEVGNMCNICDDDHQEEYISYKVLEREIIEGKYPDDEVEIDTKNCEIKIKEKERDNHVFLDDPDEGQKKKVKTYDRTAEFEQTQLRMILYQPTQNYECFVFSIFNQDQRQIEESGQNYNDQKSIVKKSYFFITKSTHQMRLIIKSKGNRPIISADDDIYLLKSFRCIHKTQLHEIRHYQFEQHDNISYDSAKFSNMSQDDFYSDIKLTFIQVKDIRRNVNFIPFIYQDKTLENNNFLIFDILDNSMSKPSCVNPPRKSMKYIYEDEQGYNCFSLCRTSDINEEESKVRRKKYGDYKKQTAKYQLFLLFSEKVGIIQTNEFLITHDHGSVLQPIGKKMIMLSKKSQQVYDWTLLKNFKTIPFKDTCESIKGCQLIIQTNKVNYTYINLLDQDQNNLYNYKSQIVLVGNKMFQISEDSDIYAMIISAVLRKNVITSKVFNNYEIDKILNKAIEISFGMKIPDLQYLVLNRFEDLINQSYFQAQELLQCKSICEISLGDSESINQGIKNYKEGEESHLNGSIFDVITKGDQVRKDTFREIGIAPKVLIIQKDLNFICTIERALFHKQFKSAKIILNHVHKVINSFDYHPLIMNDLPIILNSRQVTINEFFRISESERKDREREGFCNIEINFKDPEVPVFSDKSQEYIVHDVFEDHHQYELELVKKIVKRDELKLPGTVKNFVVSHTYIDFRDVILGEKVRSIQKNQTGIKIKFDNRYYADWMLKCGEQNSEFYLQESVQKLIDYQWTTTRVIMTNLFMMYIILFLLPLAITLFTEDERIHTTMLNIAIPPAIILFLIELIQMANQGFNYFYGWNLVDFSLLLVFSVLQYFSQLKQDHSLIYMPEAKMLLILLAFLKLLFFVRIFEEYGFLVQMIRLCVSDLVPFIISYMIFLTVFTVCFVVLKMEIDPEVREVENLSYFQMMFLQTFRTAIGELGMPMYANILAKEDSFFKSFNIALIWICWFFQTFFMLIIMLNFLIAVITSTYERVMNYQKIISYMHKAELNVENFQLISFFYSLEEYRFIVFSTSKQAGTLEDDQFSEIVDLLKKFIFQENKELKQSHDDISKNMNQVSDMQDILGERIKKRFTDLAEKQDTIRANLIQQLKDQQQVSQ